MRIVLIDDDANIRENLRTLVSIYSPESNIIGEADGVASGLECLRKLHPDLLLLDVEMKDGTGFDLLAEYGELDFKVIFVTGHDAYAIKAFKYSAIDYVLKPVDPEDLAKAINKAGSVVDENELNLKIANLLQNKRNNSANKTIVLKDAESVYLVYIKDIIRCESETNYTKFFLQDGRKIMVSKTLKEFDSLLEEHSFFRAHQSHLINLLHFDHYDKKDGGTVFMKDGSTLPVAIRKKESLMSALANL
jgi:two-component system LytT family response regulator